MASRKIEESRFYLQQNYDLETSITEEEFRDILEQAVSSHIATEKSHLNVQEVIKILDDIDVKNDKIVATIERFFKDRKEKISSSIKTKAKEFESVLLDLYRRIDVNNYSTNTTIVCRPEYPQFSIIYYTKRKSLRGKLTIQVNRASPISKDVGSPLFRIEVTQNNKMNSGRIAVVVRKGLWKKLSSEGLFHWYVNIKNKNTKYSQEVAFAIENLKEAIFNHLENSIKNLSIIEFNKEKQTLGKREEEFEEVFILNIDNIKDVDSKNRIVLSLNSIERSTHSLDNQHNYVMVVFSGQTRRMKVGEYISEQVHENTYEVLLRTITPNKKISSGFGVDFFDGQAEFKLIRVQTSLPRSR